MTRGSDGDRVSECMTGSNGTEGVLEIVWGWVRSDGLDGLEKREAGGVVREFDSGGFAVVVKEDDDEALLVRGRDVIDRRGVSVGVKGFIRSKLAAAA